MVFDKKCDFNFMYNGQSLEIVKTYKYLGLVFKCINKCDGNIFSEAFMHIQNQSRKAMYKILKDTRKIGMLSPNVALKVFDSLVLPILEYANEIWFQNKEILCIENVQLKYFKIILGVHNNTSNLAVRGETGRYPLLQKIQVLKYWSKILMKPPSSVIYKMYKILCTLNNSGFTTWCSHVEQMLYDCNLQHVWINQECDSKTIKLFSSLQHRIYNNYWFNEIRNIVSNPKLRTYCTFKFEFVLEPYLLNVKDFKLRKLITRFRVSNHSLHIEKGRHMKPKIPIEERLCYICKNDVIEDEQHFLCMCPMYKLEREEFFEKCTLVGFHGIQSNFSLPYVLNCEKLSFLLAKLLEKLYKRRESILSVNNV